MLILSRKVNESIILYLPNGEQITFTLTDYKGDETKVGIDAPDDVLILRYELIKSAS